MVQAHTIEDLKSITRNLEKQWVHLVSREMETLRQQVGDALAGEVLMSAAALFAARSVAITTAWTGERPQKLRENFVATFDVDLKLSLEKTMKAWTNKP